MLLPANEIHLRIVFCEDIAAARLLDDYRQLLCESELARLGRFRFAPDRHRDLLTRALVRTSLSAYFPTPPREWRFAPDSFGRPQIIHPQSVPICFSISHSCGAVVLALSRSQVGVDIEHVHARVAHSAIAERYFCESEIQKLRALPDHERARGFFELWTLKEAYIKARGRGLRIPLDSCEFDIRSSALHHRLTDESGHDQSGEKFWLLRSGGDYVLALCSLAAGAGLCSCSPGSAAAVPDEQNTEQRLICRIIVPLVSESAADFQELARSR